MDPRPQPRAHPHGPTKALGTHPRVHGQPCTHPWTHGQPRHTPMDPQTAPVSTHPWTHDSPAARHTPMGHRQPQVHTHGPTDSPGHTPMDYGQPWAHTHGPADSSRAHTPQNSLQDNQNQQLWPLSGTPGDPRGSRHNSQGGKDSTCAKAHISEEREDRKLVPSTSEELAAKLADKSDQYATEAKP